MAYSIFFEYVIEFVAKCNIFEGALMIRAHGCFGALWLAFSLFAIPCDAREVAIPFADVRLRGQLELSSANGLSDGVALLVHGTLAHADMEIIATLRSLLAERGLNSLAITLSLGISERSGMYDCKTPHRHRHHDAVAEIAAWREWLVAQDAGPITLVGHSRGGNQAARFALRHAEALHALVLIAPSTFDAARVANRYQAANGVSLQQVIERAQSTSEDGWLDNVGFLYCGRSRVTATSFLSYYRDDGLRDTPALLPKLAVPTLVIAGSEDTTVADVAQRSLAHLDDTHRLLVIDGADHFFRDLFAEDVADAIAESMSR